MSLATPSPGRTWFAGYKRQVRIYACVIGVGALAELTSVDIVCIITTCVDANLPRTCMNYGLYFSVD